METQEFQLVTLKKREVQYRSGSRFPLHETVVSQLRFGKWTTTDERKKRGSSWYVKCLCDCGLSNDILVYDLIRGKSTQCRSCSCVENNLKHGQNCHGQISYEYHLWQNLKTLNRLCTDWNSSFELFYKDIGNRPCVGFTLQRINPSFLYSISNFRWANSKTKYFKNISGQKFGEWIVKKEDFLGKGVRWFCQCSCGKYDYIYQKNLISGISTKCKSCAMIGKNKNIKKHGFSTNPLYRIYHGIKRRCYQKNCKCYIHYGGRGIKMCDRWLESVENFILDMGQRPSDLHSVDRIDVNGDYSPENCKWATQREQVTNRRKIHDMQNQIDELKRSLEHKDCGLSD